MKIEIMSRHDSSSPKKPYDFEIVPESGVLKEFCSDNQTELSEGDKWMEKLLLDAMRVSLFLHGRVRLIHCGRCGQAECAHEIRRWLRTKGPLQIDNVLFKASINPLPIKEGVRLGRIFM